MRKPPERVVSIQGGPPQPSVVTQADLSHMCNLQEMEWLASQAVQKVALEIRAKLQDGAIIEPGALTFDDRLNMARSKKKKDASG